MKKRSNKKNNFIPIIAILFSALFILAGCGSSGGGGGFGGKGTTSVSISMKTPPASASAAGGVSALAATPRIITSIVIEISGPGMSTITRTITVSQGVIYTENFDVPNGDDRTFDARAYNSDGILLYRAIPEIADLSGTSVPISLRMELDDIALALTVAMDELQSGDIVAARDLFRAAIAKYEAGSSALYASSNINDDGQEIAYFFYSFTRVLALFFDIESDEVIDGFHDVGDILDFFGCSSSGQEGLNFEIDCPETLQVDYPGQDVRNFMLEVMAELEGAIGNLADGKVTSNFNFRWKEPFGGANVESDYGDALFLRAVFNAAMAALKVVEAHDPNVNIPAGTDPETVTIEDFFSINSTFPSMTGSPSASIEWQGGALEDIEAAVDEIAREILVGGDVDQSDDWINMGDAFLESIHNIQIANDDIDKVKLCFDSVKYTYADCVIEGDETKDDSFDDIVLNFGPYFRGEVDVNSLWPTVDGEPGSPYFMGDDLAGFFPDPSFGNVLISVKENSLSDLNADNDGDGNADIFQSNLYFVYGGNIDYIEEWDDAFPDNPVDYGYTLLGVSSAESGDLLFSGAYNYYFIKFRAKDLGFFNEIVQIDKDLDALEMKYYDYAYEDYRYEYCCWPSSLQSFDIWNFNKIQGEPDGIGASIHVSDFILLEAPENTESIRVYPIP